MRAVKRLIVSMLLLFALGKPLDVQPLQSPVTALTAENPAAPGLASSSTPESSPAIPPLVWLGAGMLLGGAILLVARRVSPHDE
jgi:hypothetical protein